MFLLSNLPLYSEIAMTLIPEDELKREGKINLTPMVDFLFLIVAIFAILAVTRTIIYDTAIDLMHLKPETAHESLKSKKEQHLITLSINEKGEYRWLTEFNEYLMENVSAVQEQLEKQIELGQLPKEKEKIKVVLQIDKNAAWGPIVELIFGVREAGFQIFSVYETVR